MRIDDNDNGYVPPPSPPPQEPPPLDQVPELQRQVNTALDQFNFDTAKLSSLQTEQKNAQTAGQGARIRISSLEQKPTQLQNQLKIDQGRLDRANDTIAGSNALRYSHQAQADLSTARSDFDTLHGQGLLNDGGALKDGL